MTSTKKDSEKLVRQLVSQLIEEHLEHLQETNGTPPSASSTDSKVTYGPAPSYASTGKVGSGYTRGDYGGYGTGYVPKSKYVSPIRARSTVAAPDALYNTFVKPFTDVIGTAVGRTKELARRGMTLLNVAFEALMTTLIPFLTDSYDEIFAKEKADLSKIRSEYQSYYDETSRVLGSGDAKMLAFLAFPGPALTSKFVTTAPKAAAGILSVATGGLSDEYLGSSAELGRSSSSSEKSSKKSPSYMFNSYARAYGKLLSEAENKTSDSSLETKIKSKKFIDTIIDRSPAIKSVEKAALDLHRRTMAERLKPVIDIFAAKNLQDLGKAINSPIKTDDLDLEKIDPKSKMTAREAERKFIEASQETSKQAALEALEKYIAPARKAFGDDHPFVKDYDDAITAIKSGRPEQIEQLKNRIGISA